MFLNNKNSCHQIFTRANFDYNSKLDIFKITTSLIKINTMNIFEQLWIYYYFLHRQQYTSCYPVIIYCSIWYVMWSVYLVSRWLRCKIIKDRKCKWNLSSSIPALKIHFDFCILNVILPNVTSPCLQNKVCLQFQLEVHFQSDSSSDPNLPHFNSHSVLDCLKHRDWVHFWWIW